MYILLMITLSIILSYVHKTDALMDTEYIGCKDEYLFISTAANQTDASSMCQSRGYEGLAVFPHSHHLEEIKAVISTITKGIPLMNPDGIWIGYEFHGPDRFDWNWKRNDSWLYENSAFEIPWEERIGEPNLYDNIEQCARVMITPSKPLSLFLWRSTKCGAKHYPLCQRSKGIMNEIILEVDLEKSMPANQPSLQARSLLDCQVICANQCQCLATYYHISTCYVIHNMSSLDSGVTSLGLFYYKQRFSSSIFP